MSFPVPTRSDSQLRAGRKTRNTAARSWRFLSSTSPFRYVHPDRSGNRHASLSIGCCATSPCHDCLCGCRRAFSSSTAKESFRHAHRRPTHCREQTCKECHSPSECPPPSRGLPPLLSSPVPSPPTFTGYGPAEPLPVAAGMFPLGPDPAVKRVTQARLRFFTLDWSICFSKL